jgi:hypothetical protein
MDTGLRGRLGGRQSALATMWPAGSDIVQGCHVSNPVSRGSVSRAEDASGDSCPQHNGSNTKITRADFHPAERKDSLINALSLQKGARFTESGRSVMI